jgi:hypothetical protein
MTCGRNGRALLQGEDVKDKSQGCSRLRVFGTDRCARVRVDLRKTSTSTVRRKTTTAAATIVTWYLWMRLCVPTAVARTNRAPVTGRSVRRADVGSRRSSAWPAASDMPPARCPDPHGPAGVFLHPCTTTLHAPTILLESSAFDGPMGTFPLLARVKCLDGI